MKHTLIIAEAGVNHNGSIEMAKQLIDAAAIAGVDYVKFQTFKAENLVTKDAKQAEYQQRNAADDSQYAMLKKLELSESQHEELIAYCKQKGVSFLSTAFDLGSIEYLHSLNLGLWKIPSGEITNYPYLKKIAQYGEPVRAQESMEPVSCSQAPSGEYIYDFGQNFAGVIAIHVKNAKAGQVLTFRHAEVLMDGELFVKSLRTAKATATYTCKDGEQTYSPQFTYMGFRYVGMTGIQPEDIEVRAYVLHSNIASIGTFECSNPLINQLHHNIIWGGKSNFVDIPTDCP